MANFDFALKRLLSTYPLHGGIVADWHPVEDKSIPTMCVSLKGAHIRLRYNPHFVEELTLDECVGVLCHEVNHILGQHIFMQPKRFPNQAALIVATEVTANEFIKEPLPMFPVLLEHFPFLPDDEDAGTRYDRLVEADFEEERVTLDIHDWDEFQQNELLARTILGNAIGKALDDLTEEQKSKCDSNMMSQALGMAAEAQTLMTGKGTVDWRKALRRYVGQELSKSPTFDRPPRRFPDLLGVVAGNAWRTIRPVVLAIIDTSGSIGDDTLEEISAELCRMNKTHRVIVCEADDEVRNVYPYKPITEVEGRGGTDLRPALATKFLQQQHADLVVYFTDGYGPAPDKAPPVPIVWAIVEDGVKPAKYGRELRLDNQNQASNALKTRHFSRKMGEFPSPEARFRYRNPIF